MKILITGAGGFIGYHLAKKLASNNELFLVDIIPSTKIANSHWICLDLSTDFSFKDLPNGIDAIIHLAQSKYYRDFPNSAIDIFKVNSLSTIKLLEFAREKSVQKFLFASTASIYSGKRKLFKEDDYIPAPKNFYALSKYYAELLVSSYSSYINTIIFRFITVYGPGQKNMLIPNLINKIIKDEKIQIYGQKGICLNPIFIDDANEVIERSLALKQSSVINAGGVENLSILDMSETIGDVLGIKPQFEFLPDRNDIDLIGDISHMERLLHFTPKISFKEGVKKTLEIKD